MGQSPSAPVPNPFRSADAAIYRAPDRTEWERKYGTIPRELTGVDPKFLSRARAAVERDRTGLMQAEAVAKSNFSLPSNVIHLPPQTPAAGKLTTARQRLAAL